MTQQNFFLKKYNWAVTVFYNFNYINLDIIISYLENINCPNCLISDVINNINSKTLNQGFTYSNYGLKKSIVAIGKATSKEQFLNTCVHESYHLVQHITKTLNTSEEDEATLIGEIIQIMFKNIVQILGKIETLT